MSSNCSPKFLVKATLNNKVKIFQLPTPNMQTLWACVRRAFDVGESVPQSAFQGQYLDKDGESISVDTDEELMLAFAICDQPLRLNVLSCREKDQGTEEPVAFLVGPSTAESPPLSYGDAAGVLSATKVNDADLSDDSSSSDVTDNDEDAGSWLESNPRLFADAESSLKDAGVSVQAADLQSFMQLLQLSTSRLHHIIGASDRERLKVVKKMSKTVAKCHRRHAILMAKYEKIKDKEQRRKEKASSKAKGKAAFPNEQSYDAFGDWWVMEDALPAQSGECEGKKLQFRKRMLWPLFWRHALLERGVDIDAAEIRKLCAVLKIRKGRLFHLDLASRNDLRTFCSNPSAESWISSLPNPMAEDFANRGKALRRKGGGRGCGGSWRRMGRGGSHHEWNEFDFEDGPFQKGKGKGFGGWKGKGKMHGCKGKGRGWGFGGPPDDFHHEFDHEFDGVFDEWDHWNHFGKGKGKDMMWHMKGKGKGHCMGWMGKGKGMHGVQHGGKGSTTQADDRNSEVFAGSSAELDDNNGRAFWQGGRRHGEHRDGSRVWGEETGEGGKCLVRFVAHTTIPDGTVVEPGSHFLKVWSVRNDGNQPWPVQCELVTVGGGGGKGKGRDEDRGMAVNADGTSTKLVKGAAFRVPHSSVKPGDEVSIALDIHAPSKPGLYQVFFRLRDAAHGKKFGQRLWFSIMVKANTNAMDCVNPVGPIGSRKLD